tara:strand:- start:277 stop:444 length:168 start_codon:yes stop_codon:yes gene_type:complete
MNKFILCTKETGEIINIHKAKEIEDAIKYFSSLKKINSISLLEIYDVKKMIDQKK